MRIFVAYSTGAMMARIVAKLTKKEEVDLSDQSVVDEIMEKNQKEFAAAQEFVKKGGEIEKMIDGIVDNIDSSYKNQFVNWLWCSLADKDVFDNYVKEISVNGSLTTDSHMTTALHDRIVDFCTHMKKHADFRDKCREIISQINSKPNHIGILEFNTEMIEMNKEWDEKKKFMVTPDTINKAWNEIEKNEIHVDGGGKLKAYKIPNWWSLMQTCHECTTWCVAAKGDSGERYYNHYGEPYYLICDGRRKPLALVNPPSKQFKRVNDHAFCTEQDPSDIPPSERRKILFVRDVLDSVEKNSITDNMWGDFRCLTDSYIDSMKSQTESERNDTTDYAAILAENDRRKKETGQETSKKKNEDEEENVIVDSRFKDPFIQKMLKETGKSYPEFDYVKFDKARKNAIVDEFISVGSSVKIPYYVVKGLFEDGNSERLFKLMDTNPPISGSSWRIGESKTVMDFVFYLIKKSCDNTSEEDDFKKMNSFNGFFERLVKNADTDERKKFLVEFAIKSDKISQEECSKAIDQFGLDTSPDTVYYICEGINNGKIDSSFFKIVEDNINTILPVAKKIFLNRSYVDSQAGVMSLSAIVRCKGCSESLRKKIFDNLMNDDEIKSTSNYGNSHHPLEDAVYGSEGTVVNEVASRMKSEMGNENGKTTLTSQGWSEDKMKELFPCAIANKNFPKDTFDEILEFLEYGKGQKIDKWGYRTSIYSGIFGSENLTKEQFDKFLKTNPRVVVKFGWDCRYCTKAVRIALAKKVGKMNGQIFDFDKDESNEVLEAFFNARMSVGRYGDLVELMKHHEINLSDESIRNALMNVNDETLHSYDIITECCNSKNLSQDSIRYIVRNMDKWKVRWKNRIFDDLIEREDFPNDLLKEMYEKYRDKKYDSNDERELLYREMSTIVRYSSQESKKGFIEYVANDVFNGDDESDKYRELSNVLLKNPNCPEDIVKKQLEKMAKKEGSFDCYNFVNILEYVILRNIYQTDETCEFIRKVVSSVDSNFNFEGLTDGILESKYTDDDKNKMFMCYDFSKIDTRSWSEIAKWVSSKELFNKIVNDSKKVLGDVTKSCYYDTPALAENKNFSREEIAPLVDLSYGFLTGYWRRFGIDDVVMKSKYLSELVLMQEKQNKLSSSDMLKLIKEGDEDISWAVKKKVKSMQFNSAQNQYGYNRYSSVKERNIVTKVAKEMIARDMAARIAKEMCEEGSEE